MAWDTDWALEGIYMFGGPLNVHRYVIDSGWFGQTTDTYYVTHFELDDDPNIEQSLTTKMSGPIHYFSVLYLLRKWSADNSRWIQEKTFYKAWLFSLERNFHDPIHHYPWSGLVLGVACEKKDNPALK